jgi:hypothetical protein
VLFKRILQSRTARRIILLKARETSLVKEKVASESLWIAASGKQLAKVRADFVNSRGQAIIPLITRFRSIHEESYAKAIPFDRMVDGMPDPEKIEDAASIMNVAVKDNVQADIITNISAGGCASRIAQKIVERLHSEKQQ